MAVKGKKDSRKQFVLQELKEGKYSKNAPITLPSAYAADYEIRGWKGAREIWDREPLCYSENLSGRRQSSHQMSTWGRKKRMLALKKASSERRNISQQR